MTDDRKLRDAKGSSMPAMERAIDAAFNAKPLPSMRASRDHYALAVRAALRTLRVPDEAMLRALSAVVWRTALDADDLASTDMLRGWQAAIDAILAEQPAEEGR